MRSSSRTESQLPKSDTVQSENRIVPLPSEENSPSSPSDEPDEAKVRELAYQLYEQRGGVDGYELQDWIEAESIIREGRKPAA